MSLVEDSAWAYKDHVLPKDEKFEKNDRADFMVRLMRHLAVHHGIRWYRDPTSLTTEHGAWKKYVSFAGIAIVRKHNSKSDSASSSTDTASAPASDHWETLLVKNKNENFCQPTWTWPGGHVEFSDATVWDAAKRELKEECAITLEVADEKRLVGIIKDDKAFCFVLRFDDSDPRLTKISPQLSEVSDIGWRDLSIGHEGLRAARTVFDARKASPDSSFGPDSPFFHDPTLTYMPARTIMIEKLNNGKTLHGTFGQLIEMAKTNFGEGIVPESVLEEFTRLRSVSTRDIWAKRKEALSPWKSKPDRSTGSPSRFNKK